MHYRHFKTVASCALAIACASATPALNASEWTSLKVASLSGFALDYANLPDGRFVLGMGGAVQIQNTFGSIKQTAVSNTGNVVFDPSFVAIKDANTGLIGGGGAFGAATGLYNFNPSAPTTAIVTTPVTSLQNYGAVYWKNPASGHEGWLIGGTNGSAYGSGLNKGNYHNVTFVSLDGMKVGAITGDLCTYSSGIAVDASGNLFAALYEVEGSPNAANANKVIKFTVAQVETAVAAVGTGSPAPVAVASGTLVYQFDGASSIAVDSTGRVWASGFEIDYLEAYDPNSSIFRRFTPDAPAVGGAAGPTNYEVNAFSSNSVPYISFLAFDGFYNPGSDVVYGYKPESLVEMRAVTFDKPSLTASENDGTVKVKIDINPAPTVKVTVPVAYSGTALRNKQYSATATSVVFNPGDTSQTLSIKLLNNGLAGPVSNPAVVITLGKPSPVAQAGLGASGTETFTLNITNPNVAPAIAATQNFNPGEVGSAYNYTLLATNGTATVKFTATGLPPGMMIDSKTGVISGRPTPKASSA